MVNSEPKPESGRKLFYGLFIFPLMIAVGMAVLLCTVVLLTREVETPESLISDIKSGSPSKRWQKAFELSNELNREQGMIRESGVMNEVIHVLKDREEYDARTRSYMAIALSRFEKPEAALALREALRDETETDVQLHLIWGLGQRQVKEAVDDILPFVEVESVELQKMAAYVLGALGDKKVIGKLVPLLSHENRDVRWNAALSLARLGSDAGHSVLLKMLSRRTLTAQPGIDEAKKEEIMINAAKGLALLKRRDSLEALEPVAKNDESLKVRQAAIEAIKYIQS